MCKYCDSINHFDLKCDIHVKSTHWEYNIEDNDSIERINWITAITNLPMKYCPECGTKLK